MKLSKGVFGIGLGLALGVPAHTAWGQAGPPVERPGDYVERRGDGAINWSQGMLCAKGVGAPPTTAANQAQAEILAERAAVVLAQRNLLEITKGVRIDAQTMVQDAAVLTEAVLSRLNGFIQGAQVVDLKRRPNGAAEATLCMRATGEMANLLLPPPSRPPAPSTGTAPPAPAGGGTGATVPAPPAPPAIIYTGLVVDARGLGARPAMAPRILSESGQEIYGSSVVDRAWVVQQGMAGYSKDITAAQANERVTDRPLVVKALRATGANQTDLVVANADAQTLLASAQHLSFLEKARVMIVLD